MARPKGEPTEQVRVYTADREKVYRVTDSPEETPKPVAFRKAIKKIPDRRKP